MTNSSPGRIAMIFFFLLILSPALGRAQGKNEVKISGGSTTKVGTSFHDWYCVAEPVLRLANNGIAAPIDGFINGIPDLSMNIAVMNLNCDNDNKTKVSKLEKNLQAALKSKDNPNIVFKMTKYVLKGDGTATVNGNLTIAGVTKEVYFIVKLTEHINGTNLQAQGE